MGTFTEGKLDEKNRAEKFVDVVVMLPQWTLSLTQEQFIELVLGMGVVYRGWVLCIGEGGGVEGRVIEERGFQKKGRYK